MHIIKQIGYMPGYGVNTSYKFTKQFDKKVSVSIDTVDFCPDAEIKVLVQSEPPNLYIIFHEMVQKNYQNFDLILTYDDRLLSLPNAVEFCPVGSWISDNIQIEKRNQISYLMSSKLNGFAYHIRYMIMRKFEKINSIGDFELKWHRSPPRVPSKDSFFANAKFNIACENQIMTNMFTEKLLDCFKTLTVPIYYGCTNIDKYFNPRGIIQFNNINELDNILKNLTPEVYDEMLPYVNENFEIAKPFWENNIYQRIEAEIEKLLTKKTDLAVEQENNLLYTFLLE
jgi:hypothetical protein